MGTGWTRGSRLPLRPGRSLWSSHARLSLWSCGTGGSIGTRTTRRPGRTNGTLCPSRTLSTHRTFRSTFPLRTLTPFRSLWAARTKRTSGARFTLPYLRFGSNRIITRLGARFHLVTQCSHIFRHGVAFDPGFVALGLEIVCLFPRLEP